VRIYALVVATVTISCATNHPPSQGVDQQGLAELHVDAQSLIAASVTRVTVDAAGQTQDLTLNQATGTFDGALFLPSGTQSLAASAFSGDQLVGQSQPTPVTVQIGVVTRVVLRILDRSTGPAQLFGPILDSLSFPTTTEVNHAVTFAISVVAPIGDPVTYQWTSDCADATFSTADAATTEFSRPTSGACTITVTATSNKVAQSQRFVIAVFPAGAMSGALQVSTTFVTAPLIQISLPELGCTAATANAGSDASCQTTIASPSIASYNASVLSWGGSDPGTLDVSDNCGGATGVSSRSPSDISGAWLPPASGGACLVTARAVSGDDLTATLSLAVLVRPGTPATAQPPSVFAEFENGCVFGQLPFPAGCGSFPVGGLRTVFAEIFLPDGHPGTMTLTDDCAGPQAVPPFVNNAFFGVSYAVPSLTSRTCTVTLHATTLEGSFTDVAAQYQLFGR